MSFPWVVGWLEGGRDNLKVFDTRKAAEAFAARLLGLGIKADCWEM